ncbi:hypothetical protein F4813DRAFT_135392 [Daldinia decipiens]|uniref:uncharacterized protein n=1 Tax=Daldinia decipiens TaxID=326647 RepID=UPI0020C2F46E|nr:uncharacterized protein F4813DRAFT_135392 [Daldinia decipiens]KAI1656456.1 hypothetical protein F4813DRAFT_135392 [Daldinia decipiens]
MSFLSVKNAFRSQTMTKDKLLKSAHGLDVALDCVTHFESLQDRGGYDCRKQFPYELYKKGVQKKLIDIWMADAPSVRVLDGVGYNYSASYAGSEFAKSLRVRNRESAIVLRVHVKNPSETPKIVLLQILGSLIWSLITLVPDEFSTSEGLHKRKFETFVGRGPGSLDAGLGILQSLPILQLDGKTMLCVVDGLDLAEDESTLSELKQLVTILRDVMAKNRAHLLYTLSKGSEVIR